MSHFRFTGHVEESSVPLHISLQNLFQSFIFFGDNFLQFFQTPLHVLRRLIRVTCVINILHCQSVSSNRLQLLSPPPWSSVKLSLAIIFSIHNTQPRIVNFMKISGYTNNNVLRITPVREREITNWYRKMLHACSIKNYWVMSEVSMAVTMKNAVFWDVKPCGSCKNRRFGGR
jgi:hypothetical protein